MTFQKFFQDIKIPRFILKRKFNTYLLKEHYLVFLQKLRIIRTVPNIVYQRYSASQLRKRGYLHFLKDRPRHSIPPDFADLLFLYQTVRRRKPRFILEFGSGCSTVILAQALFDNKRDLSEETGYLFSVEVEPYWAEVTAKSMPAHLQGFYEIVYSPLLETYYAGTPVFRHAKIPDVSPDLIYLDGPPLTPQRKVAVDVLDIEGRFPAGFYMIVDGRWENVMFLRRHLRRQYRFKYRWLFHNSVFRLIETVPKKMENSL